MRDLFSVRNPRTGGKISHAWVIAGLPGTFTPKSTLSTPQTMSLKSKATPKIWAKFTFGWLHPGLGKTAEDEELEFFLYFLFYYFPQNALSLIEDRYSFPNVTSGVCLCRIWILLRYFPWISLVGRLPCQPQAGLGCRIIKFLLPVLLCFSIITHSL